MVPLRLLYRTVRPTFTPARWSTFSSDLLKRLGSVTKIAVWGRLAP